MKTSFILTLIAVLTFSLSSCDTNNASEVLYSLTPELTSDEAEDLTFMREEEKLARDVYIYAYAKYGLNVFNNISSSEQTHMDRIGALIVTYDLVDPVTDDTPGVFQNEDLKGLYVALTAQVDESLVTALTVGATIEDLDIKDLEQAIEQATQADIQVAYEGLMCGSRNHLRSFVGLLPQIGGDYTPQFISEGEYEEILASDSEQCGLGAGNQGQGNGQGGNGQNGNGGN